MNSHRRDDRRPTDGLPDIEHLIEHIEDWAALPGEPLVSVWMITYNHEPFIRQALDSILIQKVDFPYEIVIGEDKSTDNTREIVREYQQRHPDKIRLRLAKENLHSQRLKPGLGVLRACRGKYVALLEGDDYWTNPLKLQKQVDSLEHRPDCVACHHWHTYKYEPGTIDNGTPLQGYWPRETGTVRDILADRMRVKTRTVMYRNYFSQPGIIPAWVTRVAYGDVPLSMVMGKFGDFHFIDESMAVYRITGKGISRSGLDKSPEYIVDHMQKWIAIWDYGSSYHDFAYDVEAIPTTLKFYETIRKTVNSRLSVMLPLILKRLCTRPSPPLRNARIARSLFIRLLATKSIAVSKRLKRQIRSRVRS